MPVVQNYIDKDVLCPYYHKVDRRKIICEGVEETLSTQHFFETGESKRAYLEKYCCGYWRDCRCANMLEMMWEENLAGK